MKAVWIERLADEEDLIWTKGIDNGTHSIDTKEPGTPPTYSNPRGRLTWGPLPPTLTPDVDWPELLSDVGVEGGDIDIVTSVVTDLLMKLKQDLHIYTTRAKHITYDAYFVILHVIPVFHKSFP